MGNKDYYYYRLQNIEQWNLKKNKTYKKVVRFISQFTAIYELKFSQGKGYCNIGV